MAESTGKKTMTGRISRLALLGLIVCPLVVAGCVSKAARGPRLRYQDYAGRPIERFNIIKLHDWRVVGRNTVLVYNSASEAYLITVRTPCPDLDFAHVLGVTNTFGEVSLIEHVTADRDVCAISGIRPVDLKAMAEDREAARRRQSPAE